MELKAFKKAVGEPLEKAGFAHKGQTWFVDNQEVLALASLQKSQYSTLFFLNLGFWLKGMAPPPAIPPGENLCHARIRAEALFSDLATELTALLERDSAMDEQSRVAGLERILTTLVIPFLVEGFTNDGLKRHISEGKFRRGLVLLDAKRYLGLG